MIYLEYHQNTKKHLTGGLSDLGLSDFELNEVDTDDSSIDDELMSPFSSSPLLNKLFEENFNIMAKTRRRRHGISEECCRKPCTVSELKAYCTN